MYYSYCCVIHLYCKHVLEIVYNKVKIKHYCVPGIHVEVFLVYCMMLTTNIIAVKP